MALFGARKQQQFGQIPQQMTPLQAYGDGSTPAMMQQPQQQPEQEQRFKPNILGVIGDAMQVFGGGQATYMQGVNEQRQRAELMRQRAQMAQQERETGWQDWVRKQEYERANPSPVNNDTTADYEYIRQKLGDEAANNFLRLKTERPQTTIIDNGDGTKTIYQVPQGGGMPSGAPTAPVGKLRPLGGQPAGTSPFAQ